MAEQRQELDRGEPATPAKLDKAHERGCIVRSGDLVFAGVLLATVACVYGLGIQAMDGMAMLMRRGLSLVSHHAPNDASVLGYSCTLGSIAVTVIAPVVFSLWLTVILVGVAQAHGVFTTQPLTPDVSRLSPAKGLQRFFSAKSLHDLWRTAVKLGVIIAAMGVWGQHQLGDLLRLAGFQSRPMAQAMLALLGSALTLLAALMLVFGFLEWSINRWEFMKQMRMSKREIKDEHKEREGDPRIKSRLRELRQEWLKRTRQFAKVRSADVLLTNPTHYAIALVYRHGEMPAPMITARGAGQMAQRMRAEARRRSVPVVENAPLAQALFALGETQIFVPEENFNEVARVLRWVYAARSQRTH